MPYLQVEVSVVEGLAARLAAAGGITEDQAIGGLVRLWHLAWTRKVDRLSRVAIAACFPGSNWDLLIQGLVEFEFLAPAENSWIVRGADRRLGLLAARQKAAANTNAKRQETARSADGPPYGQPLKSDGPPYGQATVLHPAPSTQKPSTQKKQQALALEGSQFSEAQKAIAETWAIELGGKYGWQGAKDSDALKRLLKKASIPEINDRWGAGLRTPSDKWHGVRTVAQLDSKWNDLADKVPREAAMAPIDRMRAALGRYELAVGDGEAVREVNGRWVYETPDRFRAEHLRETYAGLFDVAEVSP